MYTNNYIFFIDKNNGASCDPNKRPFVTCDLLDDARDTLHYQQDVEMLLMGRTHYGKQKKS